MVKKPDFSLDNFKKWMEDHEQENPAEEMVGLEVQPKINVKKLMSKMDVEYGNDEEELSKEFVENGGIVLENIDKRFLILVKSGSFRLHGKYVESKD